MKAGFVEFGAACDGIRQARTEATRLEAARAFLHQADASTQALAWRLWTEGVPVPLQPSTLARAACRWLDLPFDPVFAACREAVGNSIETIRLLAENLGKGGRENPDLATVEAWLKELARSADTPTKYERLVAIWDRLPPREAYWLVRLAAAGGPRLGLEPVPGPESEPGLLHTVVLYTSGTEITLGVRAEAGFVPIGKTYAFPTADTAAVQQRLKALRVEYFGHTISYRPELVVETEFGDLVRNGRTKAGWVLKSVRIRRIAWELSPDSVADLATVHTLGRSRAR